MKEKFLYVFKARIAILNHTTSEVDLIETEKEFYDENPIIAREHVFGYLDSFIHGLLLSLGLTETDIQSIDDRQLRKLLTPYMDPESDKNRQDDRELILNPYILNRITVGFVLEGDEHIIYSISATNSDMPLPVSRLDLEEEFDFYARNNYDTKQYETKVKYFDVDEFLEGYEETAYGEHLILRTPFDWRGYDKKYWWAMPDEQQEQSEISREEVLKTIISKGESETVEFKPCLLYHFQFKSYSKAVKYVVARTINSFLNARGGLLFIGVNDKKELQGLSYDYSLARPHGKDIRDYFRLEVDKIIREHFKEFANNIRGDFEVIDGVEVFVFTVYPSKKYPSFIRNAEGAKEFYVRLTTSSEPYSDIEQVARYCIDRWAVSDNNR